MKADLVKLIREQNPTTIQSWRDNHPGKQLDLARANLSGLNLSGVNLSGANLYRANLESTDLSYSDLSNANLIEANLSAYDPPPCKLSHANLTRAQLKGANLWRADLSYACLVDTDLRKAKITDCWVYGVSVWNVKLEGAEQSNLIIVPAGDPFITVDYLDVAQFIYLLLNNKKIRAVIDTVGKKAVLILGRFTEKRKVVLDSLRNELRNRGFLPILFDFAKPSRRNLTETVSTLAHLARFIIADLTDAKSIPQELQHIIPSLPSVPVQPLLLSSQREYAMFKDLLDFLSVLMPHRYNSLKDLLASLGKKVIAPAEAKAQEIEKRRKTLEKSIGAVKADQTTA
jgi:Pentapeptide repeats (8 copies)